MLQEEDSLCCGLTHTTNLSLTRVTTDFDNLFTRDEGTEVRILPAVEIIGKSEIFKPLYKKYTHNYVTSWRMW